ncbi:hypothetical protein BpHYR1_006432 [Brachionus plicatilis]|uniref:Uncharacterized protein n=1 Tax=Brachionus plicatilis TaxID=10195 RepID=A0A3M7SXN0_BRAPC|nr:hypothetical protein BpHYR1_006432 [Brachionus plicatilis]
MLIYENAKKMPPNFEKLTFKQYFGLYHQLDCSAFYFFNSDYNYFFVFCFFQQSLSKFLSSYDEFLSLIPNHLKIVLNPTQQNNYYSNIMSEKDQITELVSALKSSMVINPIEIFNKISKQMDNLEIKLTDHITDSNLKFAAVDQQLKIINEIGSNSGLRFSNSLLTDINSQIHVIKIDRQPIPHLIKSIREFKNLSGQQVDDFLNYYGILDQEDEPLEKHLKLAAHLGINKLIIQEYFLTNFDILKINKMFQIKERQRIHCYYLDQENNSICRMMCNCLQS